MPKKKDKTTGEKTDEKKKTSRKESPVNKTGFDDKEKDLYLIQIRHLTEELERYELKCAKLERQNTDLVSQLSTLEEDRKGIAEHLRHSLLEKDGEVEDLSEQLESLQKAFAQDRDALQLQHIQTRQQLQDQIQELVEKNETLAERLAALEEFQPQRDELLSNVASLEKQLALQSEEHKDEIHSLEMKTLMERKRWDKELEKQAAAAAAEVQHLVQQRLPETTRLALQDVLEVKARCSQLAELARLLTEENSGLRRRRSQLSADVDVLEQMLRKTSRMSCVHKKKVDELTDTCQKLQVEQEECRQQLERLRAEHTQVLAEMEDLRAASLDPDWSSQVQVAGGGPGDPCLEPRPSQKQNLLSRTAAGSGSTAIPLLRKPVSRTLSSSRNPAQPDVGQSRDVKPSMKHKRPW